VAPHADYGPFFAHPATHISLSGSIFLAFMIPLYNHGKAIRSGPGQVLGRTLATFNAITQAATPLGMLAAGCLLDSKGIAGTLLFLGLTLLVVGASVLGLCAVHRLNVNALPLKPIEEQL
jgi:hypothetical protein